VLIIGLTGGIGSGKSTVARCFSALGTPVIDADEIAHELVTPGSPALKTILTRFGPAILTRRGELDRAELRQIIFDEPQQRRALEAILHPLIYQEMHRRISRIDAPYCILCIPLLVETRADAPVERILVIDSPPELQRLRTMARDGLSAAEFSAIAQSQASREQRLAVADDLIVNNNGREALRRQVEALHRKYLEMAANPVADQQGKPGKDL